MDTLLVALLGWTIFLVAGGLTFVFHVCRRLERLEEEVFGLEPEPEGGHP